MRMPNLLKISSNKLSVLSNFTLKQRYILFKVFKKNTDDYNILKTIEELQELSLVLTQKHLKPTKVEDKEIIDEIGDVLIRLEILLNYYNNHEVSKRIEYKLNKFEEYLKKYKSI